MLFIYGFGLNAQNLEHTFNGYFQTIIIDGSVYYYNMYPISPSSNAITIYDDNFNLYKNINITPPNNYEINSISMINDSHFIVTFMNPTASNLNDWHIHKIYNTNGNVIKDFGKSYLSGIYSTSNKIVRVKFKYITDSEDISYTTEIYSNPFVTSLNETTNNNFSFPFPNPANNIITLPYNIKTANSEMYIYDVNGKLIEKKAIDSSSDKILLNIEGYTPGLYLYTIEGIPQKFIVK